MLRRIAPFLMWLVAGAVIAALFPRIGMEERSPLLLAEEGIHQTFNSEGQTGHFPLKLLKKIKGTAIRGQVVLRGKSRCRPADRARPAERSATDPPLFLLYHAFLFYDLT